MRKKLLIGGIVIGIAILGVGAYKIATGLLNSNISEIGTPTKVTEVTQPKTDEEKTRLTNVINGTVASPIEEAINMAHAMANSLIEADNIWGATPMNKINVEKLIILINEIPDASEQKATLLEIANRWKLSDFSKVDEDHDTVWSMLNGTIGESTGINKKEVTKAVVNMK